MLVGGVAGGAFDLGVWRPLRRRKTGLIAMMVASIGLSLLIRYVFLYFFAGRTRPYSDYFAQTAVDIGPISVPPRDLWSIAISLTVLIRSEERRVGKECVSTCRSRWSPNH